MLIDKSKKAQGMSLKMVIVAVLCLIVLIVLILIFTGRIGVFSKQASEVSADYSATKCEIPGTGRQCRSKTECDGVSGFWQATDTSKKLYTDCYSGGCCSA